MSRALIIIGLAIAAVNFLWPWIARSGLGRLPGDIWIHRGNFTFYAPLTTSILVSLVLFLILWLLSRSLEIKLRGRLVRRLQAISLAARLAFGLCIPAALAAKIPDPETLAARSGAQPQTLTVIEPHLSTPQHPVEVGYRVFPASAALAAALGPDWAARAKTIEFRALDGYVSRIDVARLTSGKAYFAFARADGSPFAVDNLTQNEKHIPLGPYYLVWDNRSDPELLDAGASDWPYQVDDASLFNTSDAALRPAGFDPALEPGLADVKANCLTCHRVNGFGGDKAGGNLAAIARGLTMADFVKWVLEPSAVMPDTTMPALSPYLPEAKRRARAESIYEYLSQVPIAHDP